MGFEAGNPCATNCQWELILGKARPVCEPTSYVGWACWSCWNESRRFLRRAHLTDNSQPWILPGIGAVSGFEAMMLAVDAIAIFAFVFWWFRMKR